MEKFDVIVVGSGLAGLTAGLEISEEGKSVLVIEKNKVLGGRTSSWNEDGMIVESGFHRHIGYYKKMSEVLQKVGVDVDDIVQWEEKVDIRIKGKNENAVFGISPIFGPIATIKGALGNNDILSLNDKLSLIAFFTNGFLHYIKNPDELDQLSVRDYAKKFELSENALHYAIIPLSAGIFFLPPERYSAKVFFGLFLPGIPRFYKMRIGGYLGGMTDILATPIANAIKMRDGIIRVNTKVNRLLVEEGEVKGVLLEEQTKIYADYVVVAANLAGAKAILKDDFSTHPAFSDMFQLPTMPAVTIQMEFSEPILPYDRTTFTPLTSIASLAEQSRSTFTHVPGRLSLILTPPEKFLPMQPEEILKIVQQDGRELGLDLESGLTNYRVVSHPEEFHSLEPNHDHLRPDQQTPIKRLVLAGDYTRQPFFATMEGAVISGMKAAELVLGKSIL
ncbi:hydroxysqualene dehydroxylase [Lysinibacillus antri]|uniref:FAD-dependent oxidoreductase n=1 Tax=Lysinibacillus antri TaxID=2498145 RepID=A0A432LAA7_9BACI|nr:FAD-dependent oxidoreductase [Lysinibacillus antri]RUL51293.1 FAD-dependent oxidoreductase [Lysinibacillus antri]